MNTKRWIAGVVALMATLCLFPTQSVQAQTKVAIVDVGRIFKSHPQFPQQLEALKKQADQLKASSIAAQQTLVQKAEALKNYEPGTTEYQATEAELARESAAMQVAQRGETRKLMQREAQLHFDTYEQVKQVIAQYCDAQQIRLVLRYNSDSMNPKVPASVMQRVNSSVIFHNPSNDITDVIIRQLGGQVNSANASPNALNR